VPGYGIALRNGVSQWVLFLSVHLSFICYFLTTNCNYFFSELLLEKMGSTTTRRDTKVDRDALVRQLSIGQQKMATLPTSSVLQYLTGEGGTEEWPLLQCQNIFILPGVPEFFERKIKSVAAYLPSTTPQRAEDVGLEMDHSPLRQGKQCPPSNSRRVSYRIVLSLDEDAIVSALNAAVEAHPHVSFGSYPMFNNPECRTIITLEGRLHNKESITKDAIIDGTGDGVQTSSVYFSNVEIRKNLESALDNLKSSLPEEGIVFIDTNDDLTMS
jgi:molybdopterin-biosynthesis enzyme MoeA-like protein